MALIGREAAVLEHPNPCTTGKSGLVEDETRNVLRIGGSIVPKKGAVLEVEGRTIEGDELMGRPEERKWSDWT